MNVTVILLAGGFSSRVFQELGIPKLLISVKGKPWLESQLDRFAALGVAKMVLLLGFHYESIIKLWPKASAPFVWKGMMVQPVRNPTPSKGPFASLQCALRHLYVEQGCTEPVLLNPIDVPCPSLEVYKQLCCHIPAYWAAAPSYLGKRGHPVALNHRFAKHLLTLDVDHAQARLDTQIRALSCDKVYSFSVDSPEVLANLNTVQDYFGLMKL